MPTRDRPPHVDPPRASFSRHLRSNTYSFVFLLAGLCLIYVGSRLSPREGAHLSLTEGQQAEQRHGFEGLSRRQPFLEVHGSLLEGLQVEEKATATATDRW
jgi:hypothetical protein